MYHCFINSESIHVAIRRSNSQIYLKKLLWVQYLPELNYHAIPLEYLDEECQEKWKPFLNSTNVIEYYPSQITEDKQSQDYLKKNFITKPNKKWTLTQTNLKYKNWTAVAREGNEETTSTDGSTTDIF